MKLRDSYLPAALALQMALFLTAAPSIYAADEALDIIRKMEEKNASDSSRMKMSMIVYPDAQDAKNHRDVKILAYGQGDDNSYMVFLAPKTIKGLKLLSKGGDQWIYFASTGRRRKIASSSASKKKSVKGVGGDFSYEDMSGSEWEEKYDFRILETRKDGWLLEGTAKESDSVYSRIVVHAAEFDVPIESKYFNPARFYK